MSVEAWLNRMWPVGGSLLRGTVVSDSPEAFRQTWAEYEVKADLPSAGYHSWSVRTADGSNENLTLGSGEVRYTAVFADAALVKAVVKAVRARLLAECGAPFEKTTSRTEWRLADRRIGVFTFGGKIFPDNSDEPSGVKGAGMNVVVTPPPA